MTGTTAAAAELAIASSALTKRFRGGQLAVDHIDLAVPILAFALLRGAVRSAASYLARLSQPLR